MSTAKCEALCRLFQCEPNTRVLDLGCGKGAFLIQLAKLYDIIGIGIDLSITDCIENKRRYVPTANIQFIAMDAADYILKSGEFFDLTLCIGASFIYGGYRETIHALKQVTKPEGLLVIGEPYWLQEPNENYLKAEGYQRDTFGTHLSNVTDAEAAGFTCLYTLVSTQDEWDHYVGLSWWAIDEYVRKNPEDSDITALVAWSQWKHRYLKWGRDTLRARVEKDIPVFEQIAQDVSPELRKL